MIEKSKNQGSRKLKAALFLISMIFIIPLISAWDTNQFTLACINSSDGTTSETDTTIKNLSQSFIPTTNFNMTGISLRLMKAGTIGNVIVQLKATDGSGFPTGAALNSTTISSSSLSENPTWSWEDIDLSYSLNANTKYAIVISPTTTDGSNQLLVNINNDCGISGNAIYWDAGTWTDLAYDSYMILRGTGNGIEKILFANSNITKWLEVPKNRVLIKAYLNLSGYNSTQDAEESYICSGGGCTGCDNSMDENWATDKECFAAGITSEERFTIPTGITNVNWTFGRAMDGDGSFWIGCFNYTSNSYSNASIFNNGTIGGTIIDSRRIPQDCLNGDTLIIRTFWGATAGAHYIEGMALWNNLSVFPSNLSLNINNINLWNNSNIYNVTNNRTNNLASFINIYLSTCTITNNNCYVPFSFHSDTSGIIQYFDLLFSNEGFLENNKTYNSTSYETSTETFNIDLTYDNLAYSSISASLVYNGTTYSSTKIGTGSNIQFTRSLGLNSVGNKSFYWRIGLTNSSGVTYYNSNTNYQNVLPVQLGLCNSTLNRTYLNITFKDETYDIYMNASIPYSTFIYSLGDYSYNKTFTLINATENRNYPICFSPVDKSVNIDAYFQYSAVGYPQRIYNPDSLTYTNETTQKVLYLSSVGQTVSFQVINGAGQPIEGVDVTATRIIGSETVVVGNGITNGAGIVSFWLNYNFEHTILFQKSGYTSYTFVVIPTNTEYTIALGGTAVSINDYTQGITNKINPSNDFLDNNTIYNFNYTLTSTYWDVEEFGFSLYYQNGTLIGSQTAYSNGGIINLNADTSNQSTIYMNYYYIINSNLTTGSRTWIIQTKPSAGIWRFFQDLNRYTSLGFYGFDDFGKAILSILIILLVAGGLSARYGMASESAIMGLVFGIVLALDYNNFIPKMNIGGIIPIDHFITFITFMIMMVMIIREER